MQLFFINNDGGGFADTIEIPDGQLLRLRRAEHRLELARAKGLHLIEPALEGEVVVEARVLRVTLQDAETGHFPARLSLSARHFCDELRQLDEEFAEVRVDE